MKWVLAAEESYYIGQKVITYAGVPHTGCHEMWVCPAFWPHLSQKVKKYIEKYNKRCLRRRPKGPPWFLLFYFSMYFLTFWLKCGQNARHTHISWHPVWATPAYVITFWPK